MSIFEAKQEFHRSNGMSQSFIEMQTICDSISQGEPEVEDFEENAAASNDCESQADSLILLDYDEVEFLMGENEEIKVLISDYHRGIETLMKVYRKLVLDNMEKEHSSTHNDLSSDSIFLQNIIIRQSHQIYEMHELMKKAAAVDDDEESFIVEQISYLRKENVTLRELYNISQQIGSSDLQIHMKDQHSQTDAQSHGEAVETDNESDNDDVITVVGLDLNENDNDENDERKMAISAQEKKIQ